MSGTAPPGHSLLPQQFYWDTSVPPGKIWVGVPPSVDPSGRVVVLDTGVLGSGGGAYLPLAGGTLTGPVTLQAPLVMGSSAIQWGILPIAGNSPPTAGGAGHVVGDVITLAGGATVSVITVTAGAVTEFQVQQSGSYTTVPTGPMAQTATTGAGTGFTVTPSFGPVAASIGSMPLSSRSALQGNLVLGYQAGNAITTGAEDVFVGPYSGTQLTTGNWNTALGHRALGWETTGNALTAIGLDCMRNTRGNTDSTAVGQNAIRSWNGNENTAVGSDAMYGANDGSTNGGNNIAIGYQAMQGLAASSANNNVAIGNQSGIRLTTGNNNTFLGIYTGKFITTGTFNTIIGAGVAITTLATGSGNILIGVSSYTDTPAAGTNNMLVIQGNGSTPAITATGLNTAAPNVTMAGNVSGKAFYAGLTAGGTPGFLNVQGAVGEQKGVLIFRGATAGWGLLSSGANEDFVVSRYNDAGTYVGDGINVNRATGLVTAGTLTVNGAGTAFNVTNHAVVGGNLTGKALWAGSSAGGSPGFVNVQGAVGEQKGINLYRGGTAAWSVVSSGATDDFALQRWNDAGTYLNNPISVNRATGVVTLANGLGVTGNTGFNGATPISKPTVTGSRSANAALADLITKLASYGLFTDGTTA